MQYTEADVDRLAARLDGAALTPGEQQALQALIEFAAPHPEALAGSMGEVLQRVLFEPAPA